MVAITVGDEEAEEGLLSALAKGADRASGSGTRSSRAPMPGRGA